MGQVLCRRSPARQLSLLLACAWMVLLLQSLPARAADDWLNLGLLYDRFDLTLEEGWREEWVGPFFYTEQGPNERIWAVPPLLTYARDPSLDTARFTFAYPLFSYTTTGGQYRWQLMQLLSFAGGPTQVEEHRDRFTLFPLFFYQRSDDPEQSYLAAGPFYGELKGRLMRDEIQYVMFPLYSRTRKRDVVTRNYLYPIFHLREGEGLKGWQVWPLFGREHKEVTSRTDNFGDVEVVPGHDRTFALWPLFFNHHTGLGTTNMAWQQAFLPLYSLTRSPQRDATTVLWPFFSRIEDRGKQYTEWQTPWPFVVFADGPGKTTRRFWPLYAHAQSTNQETASYLWPVYRYNRLHNPSFERVRKRVLFFLYSDLVERNLETGKSRQRRDFLPLFTWRRDLNDNQRLQILAPLEPVLPGNKKIEQEYSPIWSLWRSQKNPSTGASSQSLLWNLYRRDVRPDSRQTSMLFGLFQSRRSQDGSDLRLFYIPVKRSAEGTPGESPRQGGTSKFDESIAPGRN